MSLCERGRGVFRVIFFSENCVIKADGVLITYYLSS